MSDNSSKQDYTDIISKEIPLVKSSFTKKQKAIIRNPRYLRLIIFIHTNGPLTLEQITEDFPEEVSVDDARSTTTTYRSLMFLKKHKLVVEVGNRITDDKLFTKTLFSLAAKYFAIKQKELDEEKKQPPIPFTNILQILEAMYPEQMILEMSLFKWLRSYVGSYNKLSQEILDSQNPEILELISIWSFPSPDELFARAIFLLILYQNESLIPKLFDCFRTEQTKLPLDEKYTRVENATDKSIKDYITKIPQVRIHLNSKSAAYQLINKSPYNYLVYVLEQGPFTLNEIIKRFNAIVITPKKPSTIYAYVKKLKDLGLVIDVGRRFVKGKKIPERLHCLAGRWIVTELDRDLDAEGSMLYNTIKASSKILQYRHPEIKSIDEQKFAFLLKKMFEFSNKTMETYSNPDNQEIRKIITSQSYWGFFYHFHTINAILISKELPTLRNELINCFSFH